MEKKKGNKNDPRMISRQTLGDSPESGPQDFVHVIPLVKGALEQAGVAAPLVKDVMAALKSAEPLEVQILNSYPAKPVYVVKVQITNQTDHGIYLESMSLIQPSKKPLVFMRGGNSFGEKEVYNPFPYLLPPSQHCELEFQFPMLDADRLMSSGVAHIEVSRLDQRERGERDFDFLIRHPK